MIENEPRFIENKQALLEELAAKRQWLGAFITLVAAHKEAISLLERKRLEVRSLWDFNRAETTIIHALMHLQSRGVMG